MYNVKLKISENSWKYLNSGYYNESNEFIREATSIWSHTHGDSTKKWSRTVGYHTNNKYLHRDAEDITCSKYDYSVWSKSCTSVQVAQVKILRPHLIWWRRFLNLVQYL